MLMWWYRLLVGNRLVKDTTVGEDTIDTFRMLGKNHDLIWILLAYLFIILIFNQAGMIITLQFNAVFRTILGSCHFRLVGENEFDWVGRLRPPVLIFLFFSLAQRAHEPCAFG